MCRPVRGLHAVLHGHTRRGQRAVDRVRPHLVTRVAHRRKPKRSPSAQSHGAERVGPELPRVGATLKFLLVEGPRSRQSALGSCLIDSELLADGHHWSTQHTIFWGVGVSVIH